MKKLVGPVVGLCALGGMSAGAFAASPDYCALYSREFTLEYSRDKSLDPKAKVWVQDRAFYRCLNLDEEPALPEASAYSEVEVPGIDGAKAPSPPSKPGAAKPVKVAGAGKSSRGHGSGLKAWSAEWKSWCAKHFPKSFDPKSGTVLPFSGPRIFCR